MTMYLDYQQKSRTSPGIGLTRFYSSEKAINQQTIYKDNLKKICSNCLILSSWL